MYLWTGFEPRISLSHHHSVAILAAPSLYDTYVYLKQLGMSPSGSKLFLVGLIT